MNATTLLYIVAKVAEMLDHQIYRWTAELVSGHTVKHLVAGIGPFLLAFMVAKRTSSSSTRLVS
jgi:hypothetical protein